MIDCLSNGSWLAPQIDFLLFLQHYRVCYFEAFDKLFLSITCLGELWIPAMICAVVYWCVDFKSGVYLFSLNGLNVIFAQIFKMMFCVYRPWILSDKIHPVSEAVAYAKGYSFPSGHSLIASSVFGGLAWILRKKVILSVLLVLLVLTVGFSRMWLGVHTPQDVVVGLALGFTLVAAMHYVLNWAEKEPDRYMYLLGFINLLGLSALVYYYCFGSYPMDYVNGELLVNPQKMVYVATVCSGYAMGQINGAFLCRRFFRFNPKNGTLKTKILRGLIGCILLTLVLKLVVQKFFMGMYNPVLAFSSTFIAGFFITFIYPMIFTKIEAAK